MMLESIKLDSQQLNLITENFGYSEDLISTPGAREYKYRVNSGEVASICFEVGVPKDSYRAVNNLRIRKRNGEQLFILQSGSKIFASNSGLVYSDAEYGYGLFPRNWDSIFSLIHEEGHVLDYLDFPLSDNERVCNLIMYLSTLPEDQREDTRNKLELILKNQFGIEADLSKHLSKDELILSVQREVKARLYETERLQAIMQFLDMVDSELHQALVTSISYYHSINIRSYLTLNPEIAGEFILDPILPSEIISSLES